MTELLPCPYLESDVELSDERTGHIARRHPDVWPQRRSELEATLSDPDAVHADPGYPGTLLFIRWFGGGARGSNMVVVVVTDAGTARHWVVTAFAARTAPKGEVAWQRP